MEERKRNSALMILLSKLNKNNDLESIALLKTMVEKDTPAMQKSFEIMTESTAISAFFGIDKMSDLGNDKPE